MWNGDHLSGNRLYDEITDVCKTIRDEGRRDEFQDFFLHPSPTVRLEAAFNYFAVDPDRATAVLEGIIKYDGPTAFSAEMLLQEIRAGRVTPP